MKAAIAPPKTRDRRSLWTVAVQHPVSFRRQSVEIQIRAPSYAVACRVAALIDPSSLFEIEIEREGQPGYCHSCGRDDYHEYADYDDGYPPPGEALRAVAHLMGPRR